MGAGLPMLAGLAGKSKSYAERLFLFPEVGALTFDATKQAIESPFCASRVQIAPKALERVYKLSCGYPYFIQEWGYQMWNRVTSGKVTIGDVDAVREKVEKRLDANFFRVRLERLTAGERDFLFAMADCQGTVRLGDVAKVLGTSVTTISKRRASLLAKGMIYSPAYGEIAFTVPMFAEFLRRNPRI